jgi:tyrosine-protein kinase
VSTLGDNTGDLLRALRRRLWLVVLAVIIGVGVGLLVAKETDKVYATSATVLLNQLNLQQQLFGPVSVQPDPARNAQTNLELADSTAFLQTVAARLGMTTSALRAHSSITVGTQSDLLSFEGRSRSQARAARIANRLASGYVADRVAAEQRDIAAAQRGLRRQLAALNRRRDISEATKRSLRGTLERRLSNATALRGSGTGATQPGSRAAEPTSPSSPAPGRSAALGGAVGLVLALALVLLLAQLDRRLRSLRQIDDAYRLPVLGAIPKHSDLKSATPYHALAAPVTEAFARLATRLAHASPPEHERDGAWIVLVTSAGPSFGKTTVTRHLAAASATLGSRALVLEADLRRPSLAEACGLPPTEAGLGAALEGHDPAAAVDAVRTVPDSADHDMPGAGFEILPVGTRRGKRTGALLASRALGETLRELARDRDLILVDSAPLAAASDSLALLNHVDAVLVVSSLGADRLEGARGLMEELRAFDATIAGLVVNRAPKRALRYGYDGHVATPVPSA